MDRDDDIAQFFADLTALFEDAAGLAADGQRPGLSRSDQIRLARALRRAGISAGKICRRIEWAL